MEHEVYTVKENQAFVAAFVTWFHANPTENNIDTASTCHREKIMT